MSAHGRERRDAPFSIGSKISATRAFLLPRRFSGGHFINIVRDAHAFRRYPHRIVHISDTRTGHSGCLQRRTITLVVPTLPLASKALSEITCSPAPVTCKSS